jgi:hypothetical protein
MKIKSVTDVITNSSTEVFIYYPNNVDEIILDLIQSILDLSEEKRSAKDLFTVTMIPHDCTVEDYEEGVENGEIDSEKYPNNNEGISKWIIDTNYSPRENWCCREYPIWEGYKIKTKIDDPKLEKIIQKINKAINMCDYEAFND